MNKKEVKYIKQIADKLPAVYEQTVSGYYEDYNDEGEIVVFPNVVNVEINHVRRMRKAYEGMGMEGIRSYLEMIHKLQIKRNEHLQHTQELQREEESLATVPSSTGTGSVDPINQDQDTVQVDEGVVGVNKRKSTEEPKKRIDKA
jgi:aspartate/tyrosine/aromatic aminotransferase